MCSPESRPAVAKGLAAGIAAAPVSLFGVAAVSGYSLTDAFITVLPPNRTQRAEIAALVATDLPARDLRAAIRSLEGSCGRPRRIRTVRAIPTLPNGKIDRERVEQILNAPRSPKKERESTVNLSRSPLPDP